MNKLKISKKFIKFSFIFLLIFNFLSTLFETTNMVQVQKSIFIEIAKNSLNILLIFSVLFAFIVEFSKFINEIEKNINNINSFKWVYKREHLKIFFNSLALILPFIILGLVSFFSKANTLLNQEFTIFVLLILSLSLMMVIVLTLMYLTYKLMLKKTLIKNYDTCLDLVILSTYFNFIYLELIETDKEFNLIEFNEETNYFISDVNEENIIKISIYFSNLLREEKKATLPPLF